MEGEDGFSAVQPHRSPYPPIDITSTPDDEHIIVRTADGVRCITTAEATPAAAQELIDVLSGAPDITSPAATTQPESSAPATMSTSTSTSDIHSHNTSLENQLLTVNHESSLGSCPPTPRYAAEPEQLLAAFVQALSSPIKDYSASYIS
jgi:hypothetical protein